MLAGSLAVAACGGGGGGAESTATATPPAATPPAAAVPTVSAARTLTCEPGDVHDVAYGAIVNNMWNIESAGAGPKTQCLTVRDSSAAGVEYGWSWEWPGADGIYAFPEVLVGATPWQAAASNDARFPRTIAATRSLVVDYDLQTTSNGKQNTVTEFWFTASNLVQGVAEGVPVKAELMIWTDASAGVVNGSVETPVAEVTIDGMRWGVYIQRDWRDVSVSDSDTNRWVLISYVALNGASAAHFDARKFFADAIERGVLLPTDYVAGLELGNEIISGAGTTWVRKFSVAVD